MRLESEESWESSLDTGAEQMSLHASYASTWVEARKIVSLTWFMITMKMCTCLLGVYKACLFMLMVLKIVNYPMKRKLSVPNV